MSVHFSSATVEWSTPQDLFDRLDAEFDFGVDVCATAENTKCAHWFTKEIDGLTANWRAWHLPVWMNPPYGRGISKWVAKAADEASKGATVVCLLPSRTDTRWWHENIQNNRNAEVRFVRGRLKFGGAKNSAPFPSVVVIFRPPRSP